MQLTDVALIEIWHQLAQDIYNKFGFNGSVMDKDNVIVHPPVGWANQLCPAIKGNDSSRVVCASAQQNLSNAANNKKEIVIGKCDLGLTKFVIPIIFKDEFLGTAGGCGFLVEDNEADEFYVSKLLNMTEKEIEKLSKTIKKVSNDNLNKAVEYVRDAVAEIVSQAQ